MKAVTQLARWDTNRRSDGLIGRPTIAKDRKPEVASSDAFDRSREIVKIAKRFGSGRAGQKRAEPMHPTIAPRR